MTKMKVTDAARLLGTGAKELIDKIAGTREGTQDALAALRKLEEQLAAKEQKEREEAERVRAEQERIRAEQERIAAANAQEEALRAAVLAEHERAKREAGEQAAQQQPEAPKAEAPKAEPQRPAEAPRAPRPQQPGTPGAQAPRSQQAGRGPRQPYTPRPFVPNPNDPNALVNRQNPRFAGQQQGANRPYGQRDGQQRPYGQRDGQQKSFGQGGNRPYGQRDGGRPFTPRDKDSDAPQQRRAPQQRSGGFARSRGPELVPVMEKERVSNYDPNKNNYQRQHDPEKKAQKPKKQIMKETVRAAGGLDDEWRRSKKPKKQQNNQPRPEPVKIEKAYMTAEKITVKDLTERIGKPAGEIIKKLLLLGIMATINQELDYDTAQLVCSEFGIELEMKKEKTYEETLEEGEAQEDKPEDLVPRPPVVTIMGHVDHGKTSLLDCIRRTHVTASEAGGITQHIGAYTAEIHGQKITFLDTPGHEAFTAMRMRGAQCTDIVVLVVAADDGIMPQTVEAINHSKAAGVPIIVAINKMDKPTANPERVKQELTEHELVPEDWGGDVICVPVSAATEMGIDNLLEMILLTAEMKELKANPNRPARGTIIEARLDKGRGPVATLLVQSGTIHVGDNIVAGTAYGRVRAMVNDKGERITDAGPSTPVEIIGFNDVPDAGDILHVTEDEKLARQVAEERRDKIKDSQLKSLQKTTLDDLFNQMQEGEIKDLNLVIKADVQGSVEAVRSSLEKLSNDEVRVRCIHGGVGAINESDISLAASSNAIVVGFNVRPDAKARTLAEREGVDVRLYRIIYDAIDEVKAAMKGLLAPKFKEVILGRAEVRQTFRVSGVGTIAGCMVTEGVMRRNGKVRLLRDNVVIFEGNLDSLKRFKDDAREVAAGYECGIGLEGYNDMKEQDIIECFVMEEVE
ncbi:MAG: translation initiation factor IF-2 [Candidatus Spyradocola sp.]|jgi:translation initiation factor IF-2